MKRLRIVKTGIELGIRVTRKQRPKDIGIWIRKEIEDLGVFSQKMGQWISNRDDLFDKEFTKELKSLQNDIRPMSSTDFSKITRDISAMIMIDEIPMATGTVGQVHKGVIKTTGDIVAIKIKKPGVTECLEEDARFVMTVASFFASMGIQEAKRVEDITRSFMNDIVLETDFEAETKHMKMFASEEGSIIIPQVYESMCDENIIVMEYIASENIFEASRLMTQKQRNKLAVRLMLLFTTQLLEGSAVHADPHPGNYGITREGSIVLYDFGNVVRMTDNLRYDIKQLIVCMISGNKREAIRIMKEDMKFAIIKADELEKWLDLYFQYIKTPGLDAKKAFSTPTTATMTATPVVFTNDVLKLVRAFSALEGTCVKISEDFNYFLMIPEFLEMLITDREFIETKVARDIERVMEGGFF